MSLLTNIMLDVNGLNNELLKELLNYIGELITFNEIPNELSTLSRDARFAQGKACIHCHSRNIIKNGRVHGKQRYLCKDCRHTFGDFSLSPLSNSKLPAHKWVKYAQSMLMGYSIRKTAKYVEVGVKTSFYMRHRLLDAIRNYMSIGNVGGVVEMDETFLAESFKGNHKKSGFKMPREPHKRGSEVKVRGISYHQVCIATAVDHSNNIVMEMVCKYTSYNDTNREYTKNYHVRAEFALKTWNGSIRVTFQMAQ